MYKLLIWGIGRCADDYMKERYFERNRIEGFIDSVQKKSFLWLSCS